MTDIIELSIFIFFSAWILKLVIELVINEQKRREYNKQYFKKREELINKIKEGL